MKKRLYRVIIGDMFSHILDETIKDIEMFPRIPDSILDGEERYTERICMSESIEGCFTSIGWKAIQDKFDQLEDADSGLRVVIFEFDVDSLDSKYLMSPEMLDEKGYVFDAYITKEWWYLLSCTPDEVSVKFLESYDMESDMEYAIPHKYRKSQLSNKELLEIINSEGMEIPWIQDLVWKE